MWRVAIVVIIFLMVFVFMAMNMHLTQVNFPFTKGFEIRTVFLLILSFCSGYGTAYFVGLAKNSKNRRKRSKGK